MCACGDQRTTLRSQFLPSTLLRQGPSILFLWCCVLEASWLPSWAVLLPLLSILKKECWDCRHLPPRLAFFFFLWVLRIELSLRHLASPKFCSLPPANLFHPLPSPTETVIPMSPPVPSLRHEPLSLIRVVWAPVEGSLLEYHQLISGYTAEETPPSTAQAAINYLQSLREACGLMNPLSIHDAS